MSGDGRSLTCERLLVRDSPHNMDAFTIHCLSGYVSCLYLLELPRLPGKPALGTAPDNERSWVLLDAGTKSDVNRLVHFLRHQCKEPRPLDVAMPLIVSTHAHPDHIGGIAPLMRTHHVGVVAAAAKHEQYYKGLGRTHWWIDTYLLQLFARMLKRRPLELQICRSDIYKFRNSLMGRGSLGEPTSWVTSRYNGRLKGGELKDLEKTGYVPLEDGSRLPMLDQWVAIQVPGHTMHMVALYHEPSHILYAADLIIGHKGEFRAPIPVDNERAFEHTLERLKHLSVSFLLLAHGGMIDLRERPGGWTGVLDEVRAHLREKGGTRGVNITHKIVQWLSGTSPEIRKFNFDEASNRLTRHRLPRGDEPAAAIFAIRD